MITIWLVLGLALHPAQAPAQGPPVPEGISEGDVVEIGGELYQLHGGVLYTLDDPALADGDLTVTVTGSRVDTTTRKVVRADTITSAEIAETGAHTLGDVLEEQAGIQVNSAFGLGQEVVMDGLDGRHVLVLIDGRPVNGRVNNSVDVGRIPVSAASVDRIEIVRGPMSALYGSEALGGVINIVTKRPAQTPYGEVELGTQIVDGALWTSLGLHGRGGAGPLAVVVDLNGALLPGIDRGVQGGPDGKGDLPDRRQLGVHAEAAMPLWDDVSFRASVDGLSSQAVTRTDAASPFADRTRSDEWSTAALLEADVLDDAQLAIDLRLARFAHVFDKLPPGSAEAPPSFCATGGVPFDPPCPAVPDLITDAVLSESRLELRYSDPLLAGLPFAEELTTSVGAVVARQRATRANGDGEDTLPGGGDRDALSLYGELLWRPVPWLALLPGARADATFPAPAGDELAISPKIAVLLDGPWGASLRTSYGRGYRLPSFDERFLRFDHSALGYIVEGNAALSPEKSHGLRAEAIWAPIDEVELAVEASLNLLEDLITEQLTGDDVDGIPVFSYANAARAYTSTVHTRASVGPWLGARLDVGYQYLINAVDSSACPASDPWFCSADQGARSLPLRAAHSLDVTARYAFALTNTVLFTRVDALSDRPVDVDVVAPGFVTWSAGVRQPLFDALEIVVAVENILDAYHPVFGPKPGRHLTLGLRAWDSLPSLLSD